MSQHSVAGLALITVLATGPAFATGDEPPVERPNRLTTRIRAFFDDNRTDEDRGLHLGPLVPGVGILSSGAGPGPMLHFWMGNLGGTPLDLHASASYSLHGYQYYDAQFGRIPPQGAALPKLDRGTTGLFPLSELEKSAAATGFHLYGSARRRDYKAEDFYGIGFTAPLTARTDYRLKDSRYEAVAQFRWKRLSLMGRGGLLRMDIGVGNDTTFPGTETTNTEATAPGLTASPEFVQLSASAWLEMRDEPRNPHRGASLGLSFARFDDRHGAAFQFNQFIADAREYLPLGRTQVVALRQVAVIDHADTGSRIPFSLLPGFGGSTFLRGYGAGRFRDEKLMALAAEYRVGVHRRVQLALIYEAGKVFGADTSFNFRNLARSYGAGIRLKSAHRVRLRVDVLHSSERTRVDVKLGPSF